MMQICYYYFRIAVYFVVIIKHLGFTIKAIMINNTHDSVLRISPNGFHSPLSTTSVNECKTNLNTFPNFLKLSLDLKVFAAHLTITISDFIIRRTCLVDQFNSSNNQTLITRSQKCAYYIIFFQFKLS